MDAGTDADTDAIDDVLTAYVDTWRHDDMEAWGRLFTADSDFVTHTGLWWSSREENVAEHQAVPAAVSEQKSRYTLSARKTSFLAPDIALVHASWAWPGFVLEPADRSGIITMVMVKQGSTWLIRASHNTRRS
jgi:uncharacterized protein (TIGR02246 family)